MGKLSLALLAGAALLASTMPAKAAVQVGPAATVSPCTNFTFNVAVIACAGGYEGNLLKDSVVSQKGKNALVALGAPGTGTFIDPKLENLSSSAPTINFSTLLTGLTVFGIHVGGAGDPNKGGTFFFAVDAGAGLDIITITNRAGANDSGLSNAALFRTGGAVPEPGTWALMLLGFGAVGSQIRRLRRRNQTPQLA